MQDLLSKAGDDFEKVLEVLAQDLTAVKTGRAKPGLVEQVMVQAYEGQPKMPLVELCNISVPDPRQLVVNPWDKSILTKIEKALAQTELNLNPVIDGEMIRIKIPALTEEVRRDLVKLVKQKLESGKVLLRSCRKTIKSEIDKREGEANVSEDDIRQSVEELNKMTEEFMQKIEQMGEEKEKELMTV